MIHPPARRRVAMYSPPPKGQGKVKGKRKIGKGIGGSQCGKGLLGKGMGKVSAFDEWPTQP